jgi:cell division protein FtsB
MTIGEEAETDLTADSGEATLGPMPRRAVRPTAADPEPDAAERADPEPPDATLSRAAATTAGSLADLPVAGLTRRRIALAIGALVAAWVILLFARQVGEASEASSRVQAMEASNAALEIEVGGLERELALIQRQAYIEQQARAYRLGTTREIPFVLADDAPPLPPDAPGMASVRLGAVVDRPTPLESWLDLLFGTAGDRPE